LTAPAQTERPARRVCGAKSYPRSGCLPTVCPRYTRTISASNASARCAATASASARLRSLLLARSAAVHVSRGASRPGTVCRHLHSGDIRFARGNAMLPLTDAQLEAKFLDSTCGSEAYAGLYERLTQFGGRHIVRDPAKDAAAA